MTTYVDANALIRLYPDIDGSSQAREQLSASKVRREWPLPVPTLLLLQRGPKQLPASGSRRTR